MFSESYSIGTERDREREREMMMREERDEKISPEGTTSNGVRAAILWLASPLCTTITTT